MADIFPVLRVLGVLLCMFGASMAVPLGASWWRHDGLWSLYALSMLATWLAGGVLWLQTRHHSRELLPRHGVMLVSLVWVVLPLFAALPLLLATHQLGRPLSFTHAYFEAVSGLTTTGSTVMTHLDTLPLSVNLWRTFMQWIGGMGILVLAVAVLPLLGVGGSQLFKAEAAGPVKDTKLTPRMTETAKGLWGVYVLFSVACALAYWAAGMTPEDALMHMFTAVSLGGLSSHDLSFAHFRSPLLEAIAVVFMLLASCNFALYFVAVRKRTLRGFWRDAEMRATMMALIGGGLVVALLLWAKNVYTLSDALRYGMFHVVSVATTTGFATTDYLAWPVFAPIFMLLLSGVATSAGSTGGGIKMVRMLILLKQARRELTRIVHDLLGIGLHAGLWRHHPHAQHGAAADRPGPGHRVLGHPGQRALHGAGPGSAGSGVFLCRADGLPALGVQPRHAAGAAGNPELHGLAHARLLAAGMG